MNQKPLSAESLLIVLRMLVLNLLRAAFGTSPLIFWFYGFGIRPRGGCSLLHFGGVEKWFGVTFAVNGKFTGLFKLGCAT